MAHIRYSTSLPRGTFCQQGERTWSSLATFPKKHLLHIACNSRHINHIFRNKMPLGTGYCHCTQDITVACVSHWRHFDTFPVMGRTQLFYILLASVQRLFFYMSIIIRHINLPYCNTNSRNLTHSHFVIPNLSCTTSIIRPSVALNVDMCP